MICYLFVFSHASLLIMFELCYYLFHFILNIFELIGHFFMKYLQVIQDVVDPRSNRY